MDELYQSGAHPDVTTNPYWTAAKWLVNPAKIADENYERAKLIEIERDFYKELSERQTIELKGLKEKKANEELKRLKEKKAND